MEQGARVGALPLVGSLCGRVGTWRAFPSLSVLLLSDPCILLVACSLDTEWT